MIERADNTINLCEVKYSDKLYTLDKDEYLKIMNRKDAFREATGTTSSVVPTMITTFGMTDGMYSDMITVKLTLDSLF